MVQYFLVVKLMFYTHSVMQISIIIRNCDCEKMGKSKTPENASFPDLIFLGAKCHVTYIVHIVSLFIQLLEFLNILKTLLLFLNKNKIY